MSARYRPDGDWYEVERIVARPWFAGSLPPVIVIEGADAVEIATAAQILVLGAGRVWRDAARRVRCGRPGVVRAKTFIGELAWCDAERYAEDAAQRASRASHDARYA